MINLFDAKFNQLYTVLFTQNFSMRTIITGVINKVFTFYYLNYYVLIYKSGFSVVCCGINIMVSCVSMLAMCGPMLRIYKGGYRQPTIRLIGCVVWLCTTNESHIQSYYLFELMNNKLFMNSCKIIAISMRRRCAIAHSIGE